MSSAALEAHERFIDQLIARGALWSPALIAAFRATPRHHFLTRLHHLYREHGEWRERVADLDNPADLRLIYADRPVTTRVCEPARGQVAVSISSSSQPSLMAQMLEDLRLAPGMNVLEVGAGTGYNAALIAHICGKVRSIDVDRAVLAEAAEHLRALPDRNVVLMHGDGRLGWPTHAPYDRIQVTAASLDLEPAWLRQLKPGGVVQLPIELAPGLSFLLQGVVHDQVFEGRLTRGASFMPLRDEGTPGRSLEDDAANLLPDPNVVQRMAAPWAEWSERRGLQHGADLGTSLAFLGWLEGCAVANHWVLDGRSNQSVTEATHGCCFGEYEWRVAGAQGEELGRRLWRTFVDAGGPRPTEFRLTATPHDVSLPREPPSARLKFERRGPLTRQRWHLPEPRERPEWD